MTALAPAWERRYSRKLIWTDFAVIAASTTAAIIIAQRAYTSNPPASAEPAGEHLVWLILHGALYVFGWLVALSAYNSRQPSVFGTGPDEYNRVIAATLMSLGLITLVQYLIGNVAQRSFVFALLVSGIALLIIGRWVWRKRLHRQRRRELNTYRTLLVGERRKSLHTARQLRANKLTGFNLVGAITAHSDGKELLAGIPVFTGYDDVLPIIERLDVDTLIVTSADTLTPQWLRRLGWELESRNVDLIVAAALTDVAGPRIHTRPVAGLPLIHVDYPRFTGWRYVAKRILDFFGALFAIIVLSPMLLAVAVLVRADSRGPTIFKQQRHGLQGKPFTMYKFRSMRDGAETELESLLDKSDGNGMLFKMKEDPRVTPIGRFIRKHSIDELPQLFNVLKGDMSFVGPRPPLPQETIKYEDWVERRLFVRPGMSGLWQVSGRSKLTWDESVRIDLYYVENWSLMGDLLILWRTVRTVIKGDGAY